MWTSIGPKTLAQATRPVSSGLGGRRVGRVGLVGEPPLYIYSPRLDGRDQPAERGSLANQIVTYERDSSRFASNGHLNGSTEMGWLRLAVRPFGGHSATSWSV